MARARQKTTKQASPKAKPARNTGRTSKVQTPDPGIPPSTGKSTTPASLPPSASVTPPPTVCDPPPEKIFVGPHEAIQMSRELDRVEQSKEKQRIKGFPANSKVRKKAAQIVALKIAGKSNDEIAKLVKLSERTLKQYLYIAGQNGWLTTADPDDDLEFRLKHKIVRNVEGILDGTLIPNDAMKEMTIAGAKGTGLFKQHDGKTAPSQMPQMAIQVNVIGAPGAAMVGGGIQNQNAQMDTFPAGTIGGAPAYVEGQEIVGVESLAGGAEDHDARPGDRAAATDHLRLPDGVPVLDRPVDGQVSGDRG